MHASLEPPSLSSPDLAAAAEGLAATAREVQSLVGELEEATFRWRPEETAWSVGHCIAHLARTARAYLPAIDRAIEKARRRGPAGDRSFRYGLPSRWFVRAMEPPPRLRFRAPATFRPEPPGSREAVMADYRSAHAALAERLRAADGLDLRVKLRSPASPLLRLPLGQAFALLAAHERRHLWQAREITRHSGFPGGSAGTAGHAASLVRRSRACDYTIRADRTPPEGGGGEEDTERER